LERRYIEQVLREEGGKVDVAALRLGIPRSTLYQKLKRFGLPKNRDS
jgi:DNA-binding NtrC family response regulator